MKEFLRYLPPIHEVQKNELFKEIVKKHKINHEKVTEMLQEVINDIRVHLLSGTWDANGNEPSKETFLKEIFMKLDQKAGSLTTYYLQKVINATGTVLHTNLGRARLSEEAINRVVEIARNYSNLEYRVEEGTRGSRHDIIEGILKQVTGAEAAMVVNNNAAAVYLVLRALASEKDVIVSRGQLVEIGGSFRVSSIMKESGANLVEVGTTNKTHLFDYEEAINENTAMIMKVHTSNFKTIGFTKTVSAEELIALKKENDHVLFYEDLGSGVLFDYRSLRIGDEPIVSEVVNQGADIISFSGDKLLGGPQAGIIVGKKELIQKLKKHQLARVLRVDKMTLAALEATLLTYLKGGKELETIPTIRDIIVPENQIEKRALDFIEQMKNQEHLTFTIQSDVSQVGGGTMPDVEIPTYTVSLTHSNKSAEEVAVSLRTGKPSIITRVKKDGVILDFRTIAQDELGEVVKACSQL
ncbi:L-seryl-tRNA(Sec) selenium transferase [Litchfieldia salsa]|uniref:L-seryl-tRNA(Sec) selenium transferase n=1 Tax=Litchfieldia salsa TaxID=930152 RepID=A0A1H0SRC8_9BACI|nr:L-seryl-tRNA(Sec) selenium transferase [Litchfieldia salsa]SDP44342.1 L-seryl-tRNA(Sec) selenium transferase [Litchfieldia salsa]